MYFAIIAFLMLAIAHAEPLDGASSGNTLTSGVGRDPTSKYPQNHISDIGARTTVIAETRERERDSIKEGIQ